MAQIKITQTSNADMNIGIPKTLTAVEWLVEQYANENYSIEVYEQAIQMEKEQIQKAFSDGQELSINNPLLPHYSSEEYYKDTYENNK